jgi:hypothetical protein
VVKAECPVPECLSDVGYGFVPEDVEGEASSYGYDGWVMPDTTSVFVAGNVAHVVVPVLDSPVPANGVGPGFSTQVLGGGDIVRGLVAWAPHTGSGTAQPGRPGNADNGFGGCCPFGLGKSLTDEEDVDNTAFLSGPTGIARRVAIDKSSLGGKGDDSIGQVGLVSLELNQKVVA